MGADSSKSAEALPQQPSNIMLDAGVDETKAVCAEAIYLIPIGVIAIIVIAITTIVNSPH